MTSKAPIFALAALTVGLSLLPGRPAAASGPLQAGALDPTFGGAGKVGTDFGQLDGIEDLAVQSDGKIVAVGSTQQPVTFDDQFALARYTRDGSLDATFGTGGKVTTEFGNRFNSAYAVALQDDGKIVAAGVTSGGSNGADIALARYNADGSLDTSFGAAGKVVTDFNSTHEGALGLAIQPDGKLVVVGYTRPIGSFETNLPDFALARYNPDGNLDTSFGGDGKVSTAFTPDWANFGYDVALAPDGKIVAAGWGLPHGAGGPGVIDVARYNADGSLDASFDGDGRVVSAPGTDNGAFAVVVQPDRRVVVAGFIEFDLGLVRYNAGGRLDLTFGSEGVARSSLGRFATAYDLVRQPDGKLVAAGVVGPGSTDFNAVGFAVARFGRSGEHDESFHGGAISTDFGAYDVAQALALQPDGKIVAGGYSAQVDNEGTTTAEDFALARYLGAPPRCKVPNVRGRKLAVARSVIAKARCRLGKVRRKTSRTVERDHVVSQSPKAGTRLPNRGRVNLVVSKGGS